MDATWNETEVTALGELLDILSERLGAAGCNDFDLPATPEGFTLHEAVEKHSSDDLPENYMAPKVYDGKIITDDWMLVSYLREKIWRTIGAKP